MAKFTFPTPPGARDDSAHGYAVNDLWWDTVKEAEYKLLDATADHAVWKSGPPGMGQANFVIASGPSSLPGAAMFNTLLRSAGGGTQDQGPLALTGVEVAIQDILDVITGLSILTGHDIETLKSLGASTRS